MRFLTVLVVGAGLAFGGLVATGNMTIGNPDEGGGPGTVVAPTKEADITSLEPALEGKSIRLCIDPTASTDKAFAESILSAMIRAVETYLPAKPAATKDGVPGVPGLDLTVRLVSTRPLAYGQPYLNVQIPAVDSLPARPDMTAPGALDPGGPYMAWKKSEAQWASDYRAAVDAAGTAAQRLGEVDLSHSSRSGVRDCVAALVSVPPKYSHATLVAASDLGDNSFTGANPDFDAKPLILIQPCADGDAKKCTHLQDEFTAWAANHGAGHTTVTRPEDAANTLSQLITGTD